MKSFSDIYINIRPQLETVEQLRLKQRKILFIVLAVFLVIAFASVYYSIYQLRVPFVAIFPIFLMVVLYVVLYLLLFNQYKYVFKDTVVLPITQSMHPPLTYLKNDFISQSKYNESNIFKRTYNRYKGEDYITGTIEKTEIEFSHIVVKHVKKSGKNSSTSIIFRGLFFIADFNKNFRGKTVVLPDYGEELLGFLNKYLQKLDFTRDELVYLEDPEFEREFKVYSTDQIEARYILTPDMMRRMLELKRKFNSSIHISFVNSKVMLAISMSESYVAPNLHESVLDEKNIEKFYNNIVACMNIVNDLNLNTRIWDKE